MIAEFVGKAFQAKAKRKTPVKWRPSCVHLEYRSAQSTPDSETMRPAQIIGVKS